jgi:hypothetical protein
MTNITPATDLHQGFSSPDATATPWAEARPHLEDAKIYWLSTVRPDGRPHVAPLMSVWLDGALYFCTGPDERKAQNLADNPHCIITTGTNALDGLDMVVEGDAVRVSDDTLLRRIAAAYEPKYGREWSYTVHDGHFYHGKGSVPEDATGGALVFEVAPRTAFGFGKGGPYSQTRFRF